MGVVVVIKVFLLTCAAFPVHTEFVSQVTHTAVTPSQVHTLAVLAQAGDHIAHVLYNCYKSDNISN